MCFASFRTPYPIIMMSIFRLISIPLLLASSVHVHGQGTIADYKRAYGLREKFSANLMHYSRMNPHWIGRGADFWYVRNTPQGETYALVKSDDGQRTQLMDAHSLAEALRGQGLTDVNDRWLNLQHCEVSASADTIRFTRNGRYWLYAIPSNHLECTGSVPPAQPSRHWMETDDEKDWGPVVSPDGTKEAFIRNDNVVVRTISTRQECQLSDDGTPGNYYSSHLVWSPDSRMVAATRIRPALKRYVYYVESSPSDQLQPRLHKQEYAKPGDELDFRVPCVFSADGQKRFIPSTQLFDHQYAVTPPVWNADNSGVTFEYNERGHKVYRVLELSANDGTVRTLVEEKEKKYVNYPLIFRQFLSDNRHLIWSSERDGYNHLYLYDRRTARPVRQITKGKWYVRGVQRVDEENRQIYFSANGVNPGEDPYLIHYYRIGFDGRHLTSLTPEEGNHEAWLSPDGRYLVDTYSTVNQAPRSVLRSTDDGSVVMALEEADISSLLKNGWKAPEVFHAPGRDGKTQMWGLIYRPTNFDPAKKYPVVEYIYSGPGGQYVPKSFLPYNWWMTSLAELGFIVVQVDGMTTSFRSKPFEEVCYKNLKDAGLPDHMAWIKAAAERYPSIDTTRVGIFGCSAGGQEAMAAVLFHPEFYKAAYSACGCHDNRMDKIWWNELWMGYPVDSAYSASSNVDNAWRLIRPLMLVGGELDDNVDPASTMQVANALVKAGKDFELVMIPGAHHTMGEDFGEHKRYDFFVRHLMGVTPPSWESLK